MGNHIKEVIIQIKSPIAFDFKDKLPEKLEEEIINSFPIPEPRDVVGKEYQITEKEEILKTEKKFKEWIFFDKDKSKHLIIGENSLTISYKKYDSFEILKNDWIPVVNEIFNSIKNLKINRIGLRYINEIELPEERSDWKNLVDEKLLQNFSLNFDNISRGFSVLNLNDDGLKTTFQYGIYNPDFPAPIKKNIFLLDYDVFFEGILSKEEVIEYSDNCKIKIRELYSKSIVS